jgi:Flp pilus assembly protein TadD
MDTSKCLWLLQGMAISCNQTFCKMQIDNKENEISVRSAPDDPMVYISRGYELSKANKNQEAEVFYRKALSLNPDLPIAHNNLGWALQMNGDLNGAILCYRKALELDRSQRLALINLASLLSRLGQIEEAKSTWRELITAYPHHRKLLDNLIGVAMRTGDLESAASYAEEYAALNHASRWYDYALRNGVPVPDNPHPPPLLSKSKIKHDIAQFTYLLKEGILADELNEVIDQYERLLASFEPFGDEVRLALNHEQRALIGDIYGRILYIRDTPRLKSVFSNNWDPAVVEDHYLNHPMGLAIIDNFLSTEAFDSLREFCLQSTVWFENRYSYGRLGAIFRNGFNCPLLIQIANELRTVFPRVIGEKHKVLQIWGFTSGQFQPVTSPHADFAVVNVNFWLTPDDANLDKETGGLEIYDKKAPENWDFDSYNNQGLKIDKFLKENQAQSIHIPYKANRCVIFNSDLFHKTAPLYFKDGYENKRINVTFLFGKRESPLPEFH